MEVIKLFANCIPVKGSERSVIYDLQRQKYDFIPNSLADMLIQHDENTIDEIKLSYNHQYDEIIDEYVDFLLEKEYVFLTKQPDLFPKLCLNWKEPSHITNAIICDNKSDHNYRTVFDKLDQLNCKALQWRFFHLESFNQLNTLLTLTDDTKLQYIEVIMPWIGEIHKEEFKKLVYNHQRIWNIRIYNAPYDHTDFIDPQKHHPVNYTTSTIENNSFCGNIFPTNFKVNVTMFTEAQSFNTCLNRKVAIGENGEIKNCPSMKEIFGNIKTDDIIQVLKTKGFQRKWHIKKDDIVVCKDCEFRYMCLDCRAYLNEDQKIAQPKKCNYNPYTAKWKGQDGYVSVKEFKHLE